MNTKRIYELIFIFLCLLFLSLSPFPIKKTENLQSNIERENIKIASYETLIPEWNVTWGKKNQEEGINLELDSSGNIYVAGFTNFSLSKKQDILLIKYNTEGEEQWNFTWGGNGDDVCNDIGIDSNDNIYLAGSTDSSGIGNLDQVLLKVNPSGDLKWERIFGNSKFESYSSIAIDSSDNIFVVGMVTNSGMFGDETDMILDRYDQSGNKNGLVIWGYSGNDYFTGIALDFENKIWIIGHNERSDEILLLRFSKQGNFEKFFHWGFYEDGIPTDISIDSSNTSSTQTPASRKILIISSFPKSAASVNPYPWIIGSEFLSSNFSWL